MPKVYNVRGNITTVTFGEGKPGQKVKRQIVVGPQPVELTDQDARTIVSMYREVQYSDKPAEEKPKEPVYFEPEYVQPETPVITVGTADVGDTDYSPDDGEPAEVEPEPEATPMYYCSKCKGNHMRDSKRGIEHAEYEIPAPTA